MKWEELHQLKEETKMQNTDPAPAPLAEYRRRPAPQPDLEVYREGDFIILPHGYDIPLSQCGSYKLILRWLLQLAGKSWMTPAVLHGFIVLACHHHKLNPWGVEPRAE
jgi:hypothetical protein